MNRIELKKILKEKIEEEYFRMKKDFPNWKEELNWNDITANVYMFSPNQVLKIFEKSLDEIETLKSTKLLQGGLTNGRN